MRVRLLTDTEATISTDTAGDDMFRIETKRFERGNEFEVISAFLKVWTLMADEGTRCSISSRRLEIIKES